MIEEKIDALIAALDKNTAALAALHAGTTAAPTPEPKAKKEKKAEPAPAATPETPAGPTKDDFRKEAQKLIDADKDSVIAELNKKYGVTRITDVVGTDKAVAALADIQAAAAKISSGGLV